ncbi:hypothetical protein ACVOMT_08160 [Sphingomonas panni]
MPTPRTPRRAIVAVLGANIALAFGPWFVRMADTGPVAAGFWRIALALPVLLIVASWGDRRALVPKRALLLPLLIGGWPSPSIWDRGISAFAARRWPMPRCSAIARC